MNRSRDDFSAATKDLLAKRVGMRCSNPNCRRSTSGPQETPLKAVNIGVAAHIAAAAEGGPRYDPNMTQEQRTSEANGIWLCQNCAKLVDNDEIRYTAQLLNKWRELSEEAALLAIENPNEEPEPMSMEGLLSLVISSEPEEWSYNDTKGTYTLRKNICVQIREARDHESRRFDEPWCTDFPDPVASREVYELYFNGHFVERFIFVNVDGDRMILPQPNSRTDLRITRYQYRLGRIVNSQKEGYDYDDYLHRAGISVDEDL